MPSRRDDLSRRRSCSDLRSPSHEVPQRRVSRGSDFSPELSPRSRASRASDGGDTLKLDRSPSLLNMGWRLTYTDDDHHDLDSPLARLSEPSPLGGRRSLLARTASTNAIGSSRTGGGTSSSSRLPVAPAQTVTGTSSVVNDAAANAVARRRRSSALMARRASSSSSLLAASAAGSLGSSAGGGVSIDSGAGGRRGSMQPAVAARRGSLLQPASRLQSPLIADRCTSFGGEDSEGNESSEGESVQSETEIAEVWREVDERVAKIFGSAKEHAGGIMRRLNDQSACAVGTNDGTLEEAHELISELEMWRELPGKCGEAAAQHIAELRLAASSAPLSKANNAAGSRDREEGSVKLTPRTASELRVDENRETFRADPRLLSQPGAAANNVF